MRGPTRCAALVGFGANLVMAHADSARAREALRSLDFMVHADLFMSPTAELADIVLPVASAFETEALRVGFEVSEAAQAHLQLRQRVVPPRGEARSDIEIVFDLANRLGLGDRFFGGEVEAAWRHQIAPSGITLEALRAHPRGIRAPVETRHRKYAETRGGVPVGFRTPSRRIELYSEEMLDHGYPPLPEFEEPRVSPRSSRDLADAFPAGSHLGQGYPFLRDAAPQRPEPSSSRARPAGRTPSGSRRRTRHTCRRMGADIDPGRQRARPRPAE